ncbi:MAG: M20 family metallopeptidase, partial [Firmicutes bacterium]|nr:M20 family metallopeptidase [Bacillota bacterium]
MTDKIALLKQRAQENIEALADQLWDIALEIHTHPELGLQEKRAAKALTDALVQAGFSVSPGTKELETSFVGRIQGSQSKPVVALLCEYDALPELGHACGHNLIGTASVGAGMALAPLMSELPGTLLVVGAPGEETYAGKAQLVDAGVFDGVDAAMMFHPSAVTQVGSSSYALDALEFVFTGRAAHAASSPEKGINALDGAIFLFNGINALREHLPDDVRIHGIISEGGVAPNVVPERAAARCYFRSARRRILDEILVKVKRIAQGAAMMSGTEVTWHNFDPSNDN